MSFSKQPTEPAADGRSGAFVLAAAHQIVVMALAERPDLLRLLAERVLGRALTGRLRLADSTVRVAAPDEVRPDLLFDDDEGRWSAVEVQGEPDPEKLRRWALLCGTLLDQRGCMGDLVVITASRRVARWAARVVDVTGALGTRLTIRPVVLLLSRDCIEALLDDSHPELALFAAWAVQRRHGPDARRVVERALHATQRLPAPLQHAQQRAILNVLSQRMRAFLKEVAMDPAKIPEGPAMRLFRLEFEAKGEARGRLEAKREALLTILAARGLDLSDAQRARVRDCTRLKTLDRWIARAGTATSADECLG